MGEDTNSDDESEDQALQPEYEEREDTHSTDLADGEGPEYFFLVAGEYPISAV
jgi:hypothetical protein